MLMKTSQPPPASFAYCGGYDVHLAGDLACPHCRRTLHASDVAIDDSRIKILNFICGGCHRDILMVEVSL